MPYYRVQQGMTPAVRALGRKPVCAKGYATLTLRSTRSLKAGSSDRCTLPTRRSSAVLHPRAPMQTRAKGYWHRPGCSWATATSNGDAKTAPRDKNCPACQHEDGAPSELSPKDFMWEHKRQMVEMRRMLEKDPYEAMFGWSNRHVSSLWTRRSPFADIQQMFQSRAAVHSTATSHTSASYSRKVPVTDDSTPASKKSDSYGQPDHKTSVTWSTSGIDENGKPFGESGSLVYDPVSGRMVPTGAEDVNHVSTSPAPATVVGKVVHAKLVEESGSPEIKYARPSTDPEEVPDDSISKAQQQKMHEIRRTEERLEAAKDRADSAVGVERDARSYGFTDPSAKESVEPSGEPPVNIENPMAKLVHVDLNEDGPTDKYVTPSSDVPPPASKEKFGGAAKAAMEQVMQRERELAEAKKHAESAVGVEEDAARAGWTSDDTPSRTVSNFDDLNRFTSGHASDPVSNLRQLDRGNKIPGTPAARKNEEGLSQAHQTSMERIQAKEREIEEAKRNLNSLKVKQHAMEQSWNREQGQRSAFDGHVRNAQKWPTPQELDQQARLREQRREGTNAWARFKNATPSKGYLTLEENNGAHELDAPSRPLSNGQVEGSSKKSSWTPGVSSQEPGRGLTKGRTQGALSVFTKDKPVRDMSFGEARNARQAWLKSLMGRKESAPAAHPPSPAESRLREEVNAQRRAMAAFENKWGQRRQQQPGDSSKNAAARTPEVVTGEGDMAPNVADFATAERWYKNKAPHVQQSEQQRARDAELVAAVRGIYERAYGAINASHKQGQMVEDEVTGQSGEGREQAPPGDFELRAYSRPARDNGEILPLSATEVEGMQLQQHVGRPAMPLAQALAQLRESSAFADFLVRNNKLREQIVFAQGDLLVTRVAAAETKATGTSPDLTPQTGNFASPTGFVNHDVLGAGSKQASRRVRKEEPVFSGAIPAQKYSVPEIVQMLNKQGMSGAANQESAPAKPPGSRPPHGGRGYERHQRRRDRKFFRLLRRTLFVGTWTAACCYATGVVIEYFRRGPVHVNEDPTASWEDRRFTRVSSGGLLGGRGGSGGSSSSSKEGEAQERLSSQQSHSRWADHFSDMPLKGFEYPLLGMLAACVWYLISVGQ